MNEKLFNADYLRFLCEKNGLNPSKKYGQNFLVNPEPIEAMIASIDISNTDTIVEVGPGFGVLTFALAQKAGKVVCFEIEKKLAEYWNKNKPNNVEIIWGNILKEFDKIKFKNYKVVANLPYQITSHVIRKFLESVNQPQEMVLMVQKEVAERICAKEGDMSLLSVATQYYAQPSIIAIITRTNFWPEPKVDSAILKLNIIKQEIDKKQSEFFFRVVHAGFTQRRKMLIKNLEPLVKKDKIKLKEILNKIGVNEKARAQELSVEQWKELGASIKDI